MFCERCGNNINPGEKFCPRCGAPQNVQGGNIPADQQQMPDMGNTFAENDATVLLTENQPMNGGFADNGASQPMQQGFGGANGFENYAPVQNNMQNNMPNGYPMANGANVPPVVVKKSGSKKIFVIVGIAAAAVALTVAGIIFIPQIFDGGSDKYNGAFYIADGKLNVAYKGKKTNKVSGPYVSSYSYYNSKMSADSKYLFYYDSMLGNFCRTDVKNGNFKDAVEIDSGISTYSINPEGTKIMYIADGSKLYTFDMKEKKKIDSDVKGFCTNSDLSAVVYQTSSDNKLYFKDKDKEPEKIANDAKLVFCSEDLSVIYYKKDNDLYVKKTGAEPKKIISDTKFKSYYDEYSGTNSSLSSISPAQGMVSSLSVSGSSIYSVTKDGKFFYTAKSEKSLPATDFFEDDMAESDKNIKEPDPNDSKYKKKSSSFFSSYTDEYYELRDKYREKERRDSFRERLKDENVSLDVYQLYFYDGQKSTLVSDMVNYVSYTPEQTFNTQGTVKYAENCVLAYSAYNKNSVEKVKMSKLSEEGNLYTYYVTSEAKSKLLESNLFYTQSGKTSVEISGVSKMTGSVATSDLKSLYFIQPDVKDDSNTSYYSASSYDYKGSLYKVEFADTKARKPKKVADDVNSVLMNKNEPVTLRNYSSSSYSGDLYINDKKIAEDVTSYCLRFFDDGSVVYYTDFRSSNSSGTLNLYDGSSSKKIADDVKDFQYIDSKNIYAIYDYSGSKGDLIFYNGNKTEKLDEDVSYFWSYYQMKKAD